MGAGWLSRAAPWALAVVIAGAGYLHMGSPGRSDLPIAEREARIAEKSPDELTPAETLTRLQRLTRTRPEDPEPHYFIGRLLASQGRDEEALRAFQSALRRDGGFTPALMALADSYVRLSGGEVGPEARRIYREVYDSAPEDLRAGFMVGLSLWQADERAAARAMWDRVAATVPVDSPRAAMLSAWIEAATEADPERMPDADAGTTRRIP